MTSLMPTYEAMGPTGQDVAREMANAARAVLRSHGFWPLNDDHAAVFDEACAVFLRDSLKTELGMRQIADDMRKEFGFESETEAQAPTKPD